jgi:hypothetical protein
MAHQMMDFTSRGFFILDEINIVICFRNISGNPVLSQFAITAVV